MSAPASNEAVSPVPPADGHRWVSLTDSNGDVWLFDATFLLSSHHCIYGQGCPSIDTAVDHTEALGCCIHGAHMVDKEDLDDVLTATKRLTDEQWQFRPRSVNSDGEFKKSGAFKKNSDGDWVTKKAKGACIFLNREGFPGGAGCALHGAALQHGERPLDWKPDVCWQVPIRLDVHSDDHGIDTVFIRAWDRRDWGDGGAEFHWWCIEEHEAYTAPNPVYKTSREELIEMVGQDMYDRLVPQLEELGRGTPVQLTSRPDSLGSR